MGRCWHIHKIGYNMAMKMYDFQLKKTIHMDKSQMLRKKSSPVRI